MKPGTKKRKVLQLDGEAYPSERHDHPEVLIVTDGSVNIVVDGKPVALNTGGMYVVPPGAMHNVAEGSKGTLVIFD